MNVATQSSASSADEIRESGGGGIPIPDSLGEEATFINICIGNGSLQCHRVLIPTAPSFGDVTAIKGGCPFRSEMTRTMVCE